jgi:hypothetical protein
MSGWLFVLADLVVLDFVCDLFGLAVLLGVPGLAGFAHLNCLVGFAWLDRFGWLFLFCGFYILIFLAGFVGFCFCWVFLDFFV